MLDSAVNYMSFFLSFLIYVDLNYFHKIERNMSSLLSNIPSFSLVLDSCFVAFPCEMWVMFFVKFISH